MGWEDPYDDMDDDEFEEIDKTVDEIQRSLINVDPSVVAEAVSEILREFKKTFGYSLKLELESKTIQYSYGYVAAHFTPKRYNKKEMYYTLIHFPKYKRSKTNFRYMLDFTDSLLTEDGTENDNGNVTTLAVANNSTHITEVLIEHWKNFE